MTKDDNSRFIAGLQHAWLRERASARIYRALAEREQTEARRNVLLKLAETEDRHAAKWAARLQELGATVPQDRDTLRDRLWRWTLVQSGTDNALKRIESSEDDDTEMYETLAREAPTEADRATITAVQHDEETHGRLMHSAGTSAAPATPNDPRSRLDS